MAFANKKKDKDAAEPKAKKDAGGSDKMPAIDWGRQKQKQAQLKRGNMFKMEEDEIEIRVLPFVHQGKAEIFHTTFTHFNPTPDVKAVNCGGSGCPICGVIEGLSKKEQDDLRANKRCRIAIIDIADEDQKIQVWPAPPSVVDEMIELGMDQKRNPDLFDLAKGKTFVVKKTGSGMKTRYKVLVGDKYPVKVKMSDVPDLIADVREESEEALQEIADQMKD